MKVLETQWIFLLLFADDFHAAVGGRQRWLTIWSVIALAEMIGMPLAWEKFSGGFRQEWVGYLLDYGRFSMGISEKRTRWVSSYFDSMEEATWLCDMRRFTECLGRLGFMSQVLPWLRPLLAPFHSWLAAAGRTGSREAPILVRLVIWSIRKKLSEGRHMSECRSREPWLGELVRTDAKCTDKHIVLGGWSLERGTDTKLAAWFSLKLGMKEAGWMAREKGGFVGSSTAAELLATLVALQVLVPNMTRDKVMKAHHIFLTAGTDNKSNESLVRKGSSTKLPMMLILIQFLMWCDSRSMRCEMKWRPRSENQPADDLTNSVYDMFDLDRQVLVDWDCLDLSFLQEALQHLASFELGCMSFDYF